MRLSKWNGVLCAVACAAVPASAVAGDVFQIKDRTSDLSDPAYGGAFDSIVESFNTLADTLETQVNDTLSSSLRTSLVSGLASANTGVTSALAGDHANSPSLFSVGAGIQGGVYLGQNGFSLAASNQIPEVGLGLQSSIIVGVKPTTFGISSIGPIDGKRLSLYISALGLGQTIQGFTANMFNFGVKGQYQIVPPRGAGFLVSWEGVNVGTGVLYSSNDVSYSASLSFDQGGGASTESMSVDLDYSLGVKSTVTTIPLEVSTSVKLLSLVTFFGGVGADVSFGGSTLTGGATGPITASSSAPGLPGGSVNIFSGTADLSLDDPDSAVGAPFIQSRIFGGMQFDLLMLKLGLEAIAQGTGAYGGAATVRLVF